MSGHKNNRSVKAGLPPGTLIHIGEKLSETTVIEVFDYNKERYKEYRFAEDNIQDISSLPPLGSDSVRWVNADGLGSIDCIEKLCKLFDIHSLVAEDILNTAHRPKTEDYGDYLYVVLKMLYITDEKTENEQFSIILGRNFVITFGEKKGDVFDFIRERIRKNGHIRNFGADYLAYSLLDAIVDGYFYVFEHLGDRIDELEEELLGRPTAESLHRIRALKRELLNMHKSILPLREVAARLERDDSDLISKSTLIYMRDVYDHIIEAIDTTETLRELMSGLMDLYLSGINNRMNEVMKVLTVISTIFIPLTFIAGIYGMNFRYMPELGWRYGYGAVMIAMLVTAVSMVVYFKRKKWF